jgi:hypothetical protein
VEYLCKLYALESTLSIDEDIAGLQNVLIAVNTSHTALKKNPEPGV